MRKNLTLIAVMAMVAMMFVTVAGFAADGAAVYKAKCASCHGASGAGDTGIGKSLKLRDFSTPDVQKQTDADLTTVVSKGKGKMPAYEGKLSADEIKAVVAQIRTFKK